MPPPAPGRPPRCAPPAPEARPAVLPHVSAVATGAFKLARTRIAQVDIYVAGIVVTVLVRRNGAGDNRIVLPYTRGECGIRFTDAALDAEVARTAIEAVKNAERRGWLHV